MFDWQNSVHERTIWNCHYLCLRIVMQVPCQSFYAESHCASQKTLYKHCGIASICVVWNHRQRMSNCKCVKLDTQTQVFIVLIIPHEYGYLYDTECHVISICIVRKDYVIMTTRSTIRKNESKLQERNTAIFVQHRNSYEEGIHKVALP